MSSPAGSLPRPPGEPPMPHQPEQGGRGGLTAVSLFMVLLVFWVMTRIEYVLIIVLFGLLLGTILEGPVALIQRRIHAPRPAAIFMVYAAIIGLLVLLVFLIIPVISDQADTFRTEIPDQLHALQAEWRGSGNQLLSGTGAQLLERALVFLDNPNSNVSVSPDAVQSVIPLLSGLTGAIVGIVTTLVITFYYLMEKAFIRKLVISQLDPRRQPRVERIWRDVEDKVGGWMRGQLILCLIIGVVATVSYGILDIRFWPLLGLWAGITEIIPIVGPWIGGIPAVIVALTQGWEKAILVGIVILCMQGLENWVLVPRVMRGAVGLSPLTVFIAILSGTQFMGVTGAILAIPIAAAIQVILTDYFTGRQVKRESQESGWRWMLNRNAYREDEDEAVELSPDNTSGDHQQKISNDVIPQSSTANTVVAPASSPPVATETGPRWKPFRGNQSGDREG